MLTTLIFLSEQKFSILWLLNGSTIPNNVDPGFNRFSSSSLSGWLEIIKSEGKASTSFLQRKLQIGYNRAARIIDMMEDEGVVSKANHVGKRDVLWWKNFF